MHSAVGCLNPRIDDGQGVLFAQSKRPTHVAVVLDLVVEPERTRAAGEQGSEECVYSGDSQCKRENPSGEGARSLGLGFCGSLAAGHLRRSRDVGCLGILFSKANRGNIHCWHGGPGGAFSSVRHLEVLTLWIIRWEPVGRDSDKCKAIQDGVCVQAKCDARFHSGILHTKRHQALLFLTSARTSRL